MSHAAAIHAIPNIDERDIILFLENDSKSNNNKIEKLYEYSSLSISQSKKSHAFFRLSKHKVNNIISMVTLNSYHDIDAYMLFEYLDYTIWGMLGNSLNGYFDGLGIRGRNSPVLQKTRGSQQKVTATYCHEVMQWFQALMA